MISRIAKLPIRLVKKILGAVSGGGRDQPAPSHDMQRQASTPPPPAPPKAEPAPQPAKAEPVKAEPAPAKKAAPKKAAPKKQAAPAKKQAAPARKKAAPKKAAPKKAAPKKAAPKKAPPAKKPAPQPSGVKVTGHEDTPNPNARKFNLDKKLFATPVSVQKADDEHALSGVVAIDGVRNVFAVNDFVTVTKADDWSWDKLGPQVTEALQKLL